MARSETRCQEPSNQHVDLESSQRTRDEGIVSRQYRLTTIAPQGSSQDARRASFETDALIGDTGGVRGEVAHTHLVEDQRRRNVLARRNTELGGDRPGAEGPVTARVR